MENARPACKPGSVPGDKPRVTVISLGQRLPEGSSDLPEGVGGPGRPSPPIWSCSRWGLPSQPVTRLLVGSYIKRLSRPTFSPLPPRERGRRYVFCCTFPILRRRASGFPEGPSFGRWPLATTAPCGARTFLPPLVGANPASGSDSPADLAFGHRTRCRC